MTAGPERSIPRDLLAKYFGRDPRLVSAFEEQARTVVQNSNDILASTESLHDASVVTLSGNAAFANEFVLANGDGTRIEPAPGTVTIAVDDTVARAVGGKVTFTAPGPVGLTLPSLGTLLSDAVPGRLFRPSIGGLVNASSDSAAATAGVPVGGVYHNGGDLRIRLT
jgi:hypothetical protein